MARLRVTLAAFALVMLITRPASASLLGPYWSHPFNGGPYVVVEDHTGALWPTHAAVNLWNYGLHYGQCTTRVHCVRVVEVTWGRNSVVGKTIFTNSGTSFTSVTIRMNNTYGYLSYRNRLQAVTQELGHSLGLNHDPFNDVMHSSLCGCTNISTYERNELARLYH